MAQSTEQWYRFSTIDRPQDTTGLDPATYLRYAWRLSALAQHQEANRWRRHYRQALPETAQSTPTLSPKALDPGHFLWPDSVRLGVVALAHPQDFQWVCNQLDQWLKQGYTRIFLAEMAAWSGLEPELLAATPAYQRLYQRLKLEKHSQFLSFAQPVPLDRLLTDLPLDLEKAGPHSNSKTLVLLVYGHPVAAWQHRTAGTSSPFRRTSIMLVLPIAQEEVDQLLPENHAWTARPVARDKQRWAGWSWQLLVHPPARYTWERASWECNPPYRPVTLLPDLFKVSYPCIVEAYPQGTAPTGWPTDVVELRRADPLPALVLTPGSYRLYLRDQAGERQLLEFDQN